MGSSRCLSLGGPAKLVTAVGTYVTTGDITLDISRDFRDIESSLAGKIDKQLQKTTINITAELAPIPAYATQLITLQPTNIGSSMFGCSDAYLDIHGRDTEKFRFHAAGLITPPIVNFSSSKNLYGEATWQAVVKNAEDLATLGNLLTRSTASFTEPSAAHSAAGWQMKGGKMFFDNSDEDPETNKWWGVETEDGISVEVVYGTTPRRDDLNGDYDLKLSDVSVVVKLKPNNISVADLMAKFPVDGPSAIPGLSLSTLAKTLDIKPSPLAENDLIFSMLAASPENDSLVWSRTVNRIGEISFVGVSSVTSGTPNPLYAFDLYEAP
jgi:hypothetical protein